jgi:hypothetical protein
VVRDGQVVHTAKSRTVADAYFELLRDEIQAASRDDPASRIKSEQAFRDVLSVRGDATRRRNEKENEKGGKGGRGGA